MILNVQPKNGGYKIVDNRLFINISIESEGIVEAAAEPIISSVVLSKKGSEDCSFGFSQSVTRIPGDIFIIDKAHPYHCALNVLQCDEDIDQLISGEYQLKVNVGVLIKNFEGKIKYIELLYSEPVFLNK